MAGDTGIAAIVVSGTNGPAEAFISLYRFLTTSGSTVAGIQLIANNSGSRVNAGGGFNYPNEATPIDQNAWAVFCWTSSSIPFYMLMQVATSSTNQSPGTPFGRVHGAPGTITSNATNYSEYGGLAFQFAMRRDGANPWTGGTGTLGNDRKGDPVWSTGSATNVFDAAHSFVWPRCNSISGTAAPFHTSGSRDKCLNIVPTAYVNGVNASGLRLHFACNFDNVAISRDIFANVGSYNYLWFGKYDLYSGSYPISSGSIKPPVPYAMVHRDTETSVDPTIGTGSANIYGSVNGNGVFEGGIAHPILSGQVVGVSVETLGGFAMERQYHPNRLYPNALVYDEFPLMLVMNESVSGTLKDNWGLMGQTDYLRFTHGQFVGDIASGSNGILSSSAVGSLRITLGSNPTTQATSKFSFPWSQNVRDSFLSGGATPGSRTGSYF